MDSRLDRPRKTIADSCSLTTCTDHLHRDASASEKVSTWFVRRSVYLAFFGRRFSPPPEVPGERIPRVANSASPRSPLFVPDDASVRASDAGIDGTLLVTEMEDVFSGAAPGIADARPSSREVVAVTAEREWLQQQELESRAAVAEQERLRREAERVAAEAAEQERLQREAIAAEQVRLRREAEERAAAAAVEQERLRREEEQRVLAEQERLQQEAQEKAVAEAAEQERLQQIQREAEEQAAEQERICREAEERAAKEEKERLAVVAEQERLCQDAAELVEQERLRQEANSAEEERIAQERAIALMHLEQGDEHVSAPNDVVPFERSSATTQIDITPDLPSLITQLREASDSPDEDHSAIAMQNVLEDGHQAASDSHAVEAPTNDVSPPRTITAGFEPITEEAEVSNPIPSVIIDDDRQLREQIAERRRADKEKVANAERAPLEIDDHFTQTRSAENEDLYQPDEEVVTPPPGRLLEPTVPLETDRTPTAIPAASASTAAPFDPSLPRNTLLEFEAIMAKGPAWPGTQETSPGNGWSRPFSDAASRRASIWTGPSLVEPQPGP